MNCPLSAFRRSHSLLALVIALTLGQALINSAHAQGAPTVALTQISSDPLTVAPASTPPKLSRMSWPTAPL